MVIYFGADHRGFELKEALKKFIKDKGYEIVDLGATEYNQDDDYPDFAAAVASKVSLDPEKARGILICGSGAGMDIAANKFKNVRSVLAISADQVFDARHDDDVNVLSIAANVLNGVEAEKIVQTFLETPFGAETRYKRRIQKIIQIENN